MSDTEDARDSRKMTDDGFIYQLRKIGPKASCPKVPELMRLNLGLTKIGRGQQNDYFLDSALLKNFISRSHVEITGQKNENGEIEFVMNDKGLNGTFVNDIRTQKSCVLEIGDKVTFGHTNGYKIEPGSYAEQPKSEFQFVFEKIPVSVKTTEVCEDYNSEESAESPVEAKKDSGSDRSFLSDLQSNNHVQKSSKSKTSHNPRNRKDSDSQSDSDNKVDKKPSKGSKKSGKSESVSKSGSSKKEEIAAPSKRRTSSTTPSKFSETLPAMKEDSDEDDEDDDDDDDDDDKGKDKEEEEDNESKEEEEEEEDVEKNEDKSDEESDSESESEEEIIPKKKRKIPQRKTPPQSSQRKIGNRGKKPVQKESSSESDDSSDNESSKPEADQKPKQNQTSSRQKLPNPPPPSRKRKPISSTGYNAPATGNKGNNSSSNANKRKKRKMSSTKTAASVSSEPVNDLEPGVEWYDEDKCDSADCKRPKKKRTPWVQCDDCDGWYHTMCVGANYNQLKDSDARFNCGCES